MFQPPPRPPDHGGVEGVHAPPGNEVHVPVALPVRQALRKTTVERVGIGGRAAAIPRRSALAGPPACAGGSFAGARQIGSRAKRTQKKSDNSGGRKSCQSPGCGHARFSGSLSESPENRLFRPCQWLRRFHKRLFGLLNRLSTAWLAALTDRSAACVFGGLGVTSRDAVRTGGVFLNGGIGGGAGRAVTVA